MALEFGTLILKLPAASVDVPVVEPFTLMLAPATGFYSTPGLGKNEVRLAYVINVTAINAAMDCLEKALEEYPGRMI